MEDAVKSIADMQKELKFIIEKTREETARSTTPLKDSLPGINDVTFIQNDVTFIK